MEKQLTSEQAIALGKSEFYKNMSAEQIVKFQLFQDKLCMPFNIFHSAVEKTLQRPVYTHEFAYVENLRKEFLGEVKPPTFEEIVDLIPKDKQILLIVGD